jgi:hypothetical protein
MGGLDNWLMSDLEVWITMAALGGAALLFVPALGAPAWAEHRRSPKLVLLALLVAGALGGLAWYGMPTSPDASASVAIADRG